MRWLDEGFQGQLPLYFDSQAVRSNNPLPPNQWWSHRVKGSSNLPPEGYFNNRNKASDFQFVSYILKVFELTF